MITFILQWVTILLIIFTFFNYAALSKFPKDSSHPSLSKVLDAALRPNSIRKDNDEYGRDLSEDYKKYKESTAADSPGIARIPSYVKAMPDVLSGPASSPSVKSLDDPAGVHGNNYSVYDINSPGGPFSKP